MSDATISTVLKGSSGKDLRAALQYTGMLKNGGNWGYALISYLRLYAEELNRAFPNAR